MQVWKTKGQIGGELKVLYKNVTLCRREGVTHVVPRETQKPLPMRATLVENDYDIILADFKYITKRKDAGSKPRRFSNQRKKCFVYAPRRHYSTAY